MRLESLSRYMRSHVFFDLNFIFQFLIRTRIQSLQEFFVGSRIIVKSVAFDWYFLNDHVGYVEKSDTIRLQHARVK